MEAIPGREVAMADGVILRPARPEDQPVIRRLAREVRRNP